jgi:hypothetical protein
MTDSDAAPPSATIDPATDPRQAGIGSALSAADPGGQAHNTPQGHKRFWRDWQPIEKFTVALVAVNLLYLCTYAYWVYLDQRSYIAFVQTTRLVYDVGRPIKIRTDFINTGKTPAYSISIRQGAIIDKPNPNRRAEDVLDSKGEVGGDVPTQRSQTIYYVTKFSLTDDQRRGLEAVDSPTTIIYAAQIKYRDHFGVAHTETSCSTWNREESAFATCGWQQE